MNNCTVGVTLVASPVILLAAAAVAAAAGVGIDADGSLSWPLQAIGMAIQFGPLLVMAGGIAVARQVAGDLRDEIKAAAESNRQAAESLRLTMETQLRVIELLAGKNG